MTESYSLAEAWEILSSHASPHRNKTKIFWVLVQNTNLAQDSFVGLHLGLFVCFFFPVFVFCSMDQIFSIKKKKSLKKAEIKKTVFTMTKFASGCLPKDTKESSKS